MIYRIEIGLQEGFIDARGNKVARRVHDDLHIPADSVKTIDVYTIDSDITREEAEIVAKEAYRDPIIHEYALDTPLARDFDWLIEVGYRPGVTDNVGKTAREVLQIILGRNLSDTQGVYTSVQYVIKGAIDRNSAERIATELLANTLIHRYEVIDRKSVQSGMKIKSFVPKVELITNPYVEEIDLEVDSKMLENISRERSLALSREEMEAIKEYLRGKEILYERSTVGLRQHITDVELEVLAQTWSEHCKHKIFNAIIEYKDEKGEKILVDSLFHTFIKRATEVVRSEKGAADFCISVFEDNAGVIKFNKEWNLVFKVETHNSPSALDPYGGALTGIVGVNRDPFGTGKGARLIFNTDVFCFADPLYSHSLPPRLLHPKRVYEGVREGVEHGGNKSGIPTVNGCIVFDNRFLGKPLVYCGTGGIMPRYINGKPSHMKKAEPDDLIVMVGGRVGKDGIHGATFSSEALHEHSPVTAVQIGDPITQKKMTDMLLIARDRELYHSITDNGAGGLSSSVGEMARESGGCEIDLEKAPIKYQGLLPWELLLSESQERMTLALAPEKIAEFLSLSKKMDVEAIVIGKFSNSGRFHVRYCGKTVAYLTMGFLHQGLPRMNLKAQWVAKQYEDPCFSEPKNLNSLLIEMLGRLNICSKEAVVRQYDHEVQGGSVVKPLVGVQGDGPSDAAVIRPLLDSFEGVVISNGICPKYSDIDTYYMMACAIDEAIRNAVSVGGDLSYMAGLDNFCWCDPVQSEKTPDGEYKLAQLVRANMALYDYTVAFGIPLISGKDSMKNDYHIGDTKISIPPTVLFSLIGKIEDVRKCITMEAKSPGDLVYVVGITLPELGGSEYYDHLGYGGCQVPVVDVKSAKKIYHAVKGAIEEGVVASCHDISDGGLGVALAEVAFSGNLGMEIDLGAVCQKDIDRDDYMLFSESQSRFVMTIKPDNMRRFEEIMRGNCFSCVGVVTEKKVLKISGFSGRIIIDTPLEVLKHSWQEKLRF